MLVKIVYANVNKYTFLPKINWIINICEVSTVEKQVFILNREQPQTLVSA